MNENKKNTFVPCGDAMEKMNGEMPDDELNAVAGGADRAAEKKYCPNCDREMALSLEFKDKTLVGMNYYCNRCGHKEKA